MIQFLTIVIVIAVFIFFLSTATLLVYFSLKKNKSLRNKIILSLFVFSFSLLLAQIILCGISANKPLEFPAGHHDAPKAKYYGWQQFPNEKIFFQNPDNGEVSCFFTNKEGWKDVNREFKKADGVKRILFLGDSNTFGVVHLEDTYTRFFEKYFDSLGYKIEAINMGMPGWGTDQELEALMLEGIKYSPDIVVYQFCDNDLSDNAIDPEKSASAHRLKPFYYTLQNNQLVRKNVAAFSERKTTAAPDFCFTKIIKNLLTQIFYSNEENNGNISVQINNNSMAHADSSVSPCNYLNPDFKPTEWHDVEMSLETYLPSGTSIDDVIGEDLRYQWKLLEKLVLRMDSVCKANNAKLVVFCESAGEAGQRNWELNWGHIYTKDSEDYVKGSFSNTGVDLKQPYRLMQDICKRNSIRLVPNKRPYERYVHDPHPNKNGNQNMAIDIAEYFIENGFME